MQTKCKNETLTRKVFKTLNCKGKAIESEYKWGECEIVDYDTSNIFYYKITFPPPVVESKNDTKNETKNGTKEES